MNVQLKSPALPFKVLFLQGSHTPDAGLRPQVGALVAKQSVAFTGNVQQSPAADNVLVKDEPYDGGQTRLESDATVIKPLVDVVVVRSTFVADNQQFGTATITRASGQSVTSLHYGWRPRTHDLRRPLAGATTIPATPPDALPEFDFDPDPLKHDPKPKIELPYRLPVQFNNAFLNGGLSNAGATPLQAGDTIRFEQTVPPDTDDLDLTVTIPAAPTLTFTRDCWAVAPPVWVRRGVDTVVLLADETRVLLTWRFVFAWEERLALATLEVG